MLNENAIEDFQGTDISHHITNEVRKDINLQIERVIIPAYGSFLVHTLKPRHINTKLPLTRGKDYEILSIDERATLKAGREVAHGFVLINENIPGVEYDYRFIGGLYSNGKYLMDEVKKRYPNGITPNFVFDYIKGKPETYPAKDHIHSAHDTYGYDGVNKQLDRVIHGIERGADTNLANIYIRASDKLAEMETTTTNDINTIRQKLTDAFEALRVQQGEYIFTDSLDNPSILRGYGTWVRVTNTILKGTQSDVIVGDGTLLLQGSAQPLRNTYIWMNKDSIVAPTYTLSIQGVTKTNNKWPVNENTTFKVLIQTTGIAKNTKLAWLITGIDDQYIDASVSKMTGEFVINDLGQATVDVRLLDNPNELGNRECVFMLEHIANTSLNILVQDTIRAKWVEMFFSHDNLGKVKAVRINEGEIVYLQLKFYGYSVGEDIYLDWSQSTVLSNEFEIVPPSLLSATASTMTVALKVKANQLTDGERSLIVYSKNAPLDDVSSTDSVAYVFVQDSSVSTNVNIDFKSTTGTILTSLSEGDTFSISLTTLLPKDSVLELIYETSKSLDEFTGLQSTVTIDVNGKASFNVTNAVDFLTNEGVQLFKVTARYQGQDVSANSIIIKDTSQTPKYTMTITAPNSTAPIAKVNEGDDFWVRLAVAGWVNTPYPPTIVFNYGLNDDYSANSKVRDRVNSSFHDRLPYSNAAGSYNDVSWVNGAELILKMTAIADRQFSGNAKFNVSMKQSNMDQFLLQSSVQIMDTSVLDIATAWSSSGVILNPITQVNEMQTDGSNNTFYLWMDVDGDGSLFNDITINAIGSATASDFITVFPSVVNFDTGKSRKIFAITLLSDFLNEGNESLTVYGTYVDVNGKVTEVFRTSITIIDNSILVPLDVKLSTSNTDPDAAPSGGKFSEYGVIYAHVTFPAYVMNTNIEWDVWTLTGTAANGQVTPVNGVVNAPTGSSGVVIQINPIADRLQDGEFKGLIKARRRLVSGNKIIGMNENIPFTLLDDSVPMTIVTKTYKDAARTQESTIFNEGDIVYGRTVVSNPSGDYFLTNNITTGNNDTTDATYTYLGATGTVVTYADQQKVKKVFSAVAGVVSYTDDFAITLRRNRTTQAKPQVIKVGGIVWKNTGNWVVGNTYPSVWDDTQLNSVKTITVNDSSKTPSYVTNAGLTENSARADNFDEGLAFVVSLNITDGEIGDVYTLTKTGNFEQERLEVSQYGVEQVTNAYNQRLNWNFKSYIGRNTNTWTTLGFDVWNKTTGLKIGHIDVNINDIYKTPTLQMRWMIGTTDYAVSIDEGDSRYEVVITGDQYLLGDEAIKLSIVSGRPLAKYGNSANFDKWYPVNIVNGVPTVRIPVYPLADKYTNPAAELIANLKAVTSVTNASVTLSRAIDDNSQTRAYTLVGWYYPGGTTPISSVNEGETVEMRVKVSGGTDIVPVKLTNNGGRTEYITHEYGVTKSRTSDNAELTWTFTVGKDFRDATGDQMRLRVNLEITDTTNTTRTETLPINNTSVASVGACNFYASGTSTVITSIKEGSNFDANFQLSKWNTGSNYRCLTKSSRNGTEWKVDATSIGSNWTTSGSNKVIKFPLSVNGDSTTNTGGELYITSELWDMDAGRLLASSSLTIIDISREPLSTNDMRIAAVGGTAQISQINEGNTVRLYFLPSCFTGTDWSDSKQFYWWLGNPGGGANSKFADGYIPQSSLAGDGSYSVNVPIPANESTDGDRTVRIELYEMFGSGNGTYFRGNSANCVIKDTSITPSIDQVYWAYDAVGGNPISIGGSSNEGDAVYLIVQGKGLANNGADVTVSLNWDGTASVADFDTTLPSSVTCKQYTSGSTTYYLGSVQVKIKADGVEG